jgi:stage II sporulation protein D
VVRIGRATHTLEPNESTLILPGPKPTLQLPGRHEQQLEDAIQFQAGSAGRIRVGSREYRGTLRAFVGSSGELALINVLSLEEYLFSVVACELGTTDPTATEALKAQAVAARSFTLARIENRRTDGYDVSDTYLRDQEYQGAGRETDIAREAVLATHGQVLTCHGRTAEALYHANCGGATSDGFQPFLKGAIDAPNRGSKPYCTGRPYHSWQVTITRDSLEKTLARATGMTRIHVRNVRLDRDARSGRVRYLRFATDQGELKLTGADFRTALGLKSQNLELRLERNKCVIAGRGHGHGFGMCQDGAVGMARSGADFRRILQHYYAGVELRRLY